MYGRQVPALGAGLPPDSLTNTHQIVIDPTIPGTYTYGYSVILNDCESDPATAEIAVLTTPLINDDFYATDINTTLDFLVFLNDSLNLNVGYTLQVTSGVSNGELIDNGNGSFTYIPNNGFVGIDQFVYRVCYDDCPEYCDFAVVTIRIEFPEDQCVIPTVITPNGDGVNDIVFISCLENGNFPENQIMIFNEWGDLIFDAQPYQNDWAGTLKDTGKELPDGVYFYIFSKQANDPEPQRGHVTVIR